MRLFIRRPRRTGPNAPPEVGLYPRHAKEPAGVPAQACGKTCCCRRRHVHLDIGNARAVVRRRDVAPRNCDRGKLSAAEIDGPALPCGRHRRNTCPPSEPGRPAENSRSWSSPCQFDPQQGGVLRLERENLSGERFNNVGFPRPAVPGSKAILFGTVFAMAALVVNQRDSLAKGVAMAAAGVWLDARRLQGFKYFRLIDDLLARLRPAGTERDKAGNRQLFFDQ